MFIKKLFLRTERALLRYVFTVILIFTLCAMINGNVNVCIPTSEDEDNTEEFYALVVKGLKEELTEGLEDNSTIFVDHSDFDLHHPALSIKGVIDNVTITNLDDFQLQFFPEINYTKNVIELFNLTFRNISAVGEFNMTGNIGDLFDIWGAGHFWASALNFSVSATTQIPIANSTTVCLFIDVKVVLQEQQSWFSGLMGDDELEELLNKAFSSVAPEAVEVIWGEFKDVIDEQLQKWVNSIKDRHTSDISVSAMKKIIKRSPIK